MTGGFSVLLNKSIIKIGIMTFWWSDDNYGQLLQCYALQKYLRNAGHDAFLIRYDPRNDYVKTPLWKKTIKAVNQVALANYLKFKIRKYSDIKEKKEHSRHFGEFRKEHIRQTDRIYYSYKELAENPPEADVYITGSDQVWNPDFIGFKNNNNQTRAFFLDFGSHATKRIAYAASFGKEWFEDDFVQEITPLLKRFDYISVREKSGLDICRQCGVTNAEWAPDPTMLLNNVDYRALYGPINQSDNEGPYCLVYMLSNECDFSIETVYDWANTINNKVLYITGNVKHDKYEKTYATIPEWLYFIDKAEYVITNSFHCSVFSLLFQKKIGVVPLTGKSTGMNSRFDSLFETFDIQQQFIDASFAVFNNYLDWNSVFDKMKNMQRTNTLLSKIKSCMELEKD
jgi:hypothetical protein